MDEEIDEEYQVPFKHKKKKHHAKEGNGSAKGLAEKPDVEVAEEEVPPTPAQLAAESLDGGEGGPLQQVGSFSTKKLRRKLAEYTEEYQFLSPDISHAAVARRDRRGDRPALPDGPPLCGGSQVLRARGLQAQGFGSKLPPMVNR